jgi:hypothetical protein
MSLRCDLDETGSHFLFASKTLSATVIPALCVLLGRKLLTTTVHPLRVKTGIQSMKNTLRSKDKSKPPFDKIAGFPLLRE